MTDHSALIERLELGSKQTITRYCGDLDGAIVSHDLLAQAAAALRDQQRRLDLWEPKPFCGASWSSSPLPSAPDQPVSEHYKLELLDQPLSNPQQLGGGA